MSSKPATCDSKEKPASTVSRAAAPNRAPYSGFAIRCITRLGQRFVFSRRHQPARASVLDELHDPADARGDDRQAAAIASRTAFGNDSYREGCTKMSADRRAAPRRRHNARRSPPVRDAVSRGPGREGLTLRSLADNLEPRIGKALEDLDGRIDQHVGVP